MAHWLSNLLKEWLNWSGGRDTAVQKGALLSGFRKSVCLKAALMLVLAEDDTARQYEKAGGGTKQSTKQTSFGTCHEYAQLSAGTACTRPGLCKR